MPMFDYKSINAAGKPQKGIVDAETAKAARIKLKKQGLVVTEIKEKSAGQTSSSSSSVPFMSGRVSSSDIAMLTRQLASLVKANIPLVEALSALGDQIEKDRLKVVLSTVRQDVNEGSSLANAIKKHPKVFDNIFVNMVEAGESSGTLNVVLMRLADLKEAQMRLRAKVLSGMTYPALMMVVGLGLIIAIFTFVIPKLTKVFDSINKTVPPTTQALMWISDIFVNWWPVLLTVAFVGSVIFNRYIVSASGRPKWDRFKLTVPLFGPLIRMIAVTRFASTMATMLGSGVPILESLRISKNLIGNSLIEKAVDHARENIKEGQSIAIPLKRSNQFPPMFIHMIAIGEKTGELPEMLNNVASTFEEQINSKIEKMTALLEPMMIIIMGGFVGFIVMSIFIPLLEISNIK